MNLRSIQDILKLGYENGASLNELSKTHNVSVSGIRSSLIRMGVRLRPKGRHNPSNKALTPYTPITKVIPSADREKWIPIRDSQETVCFICGVRREPMEIDHNHSTGVVRGILCHLHNRGLGYFQDDPELLEKASNYLKGLRNDQ